MTQLRDLILSRRAELLSQYRRISLEIRETEAALKALDALKSEAEDAEGGQSIRLREAETARMMLQRRVLPRSGVISEEAIDQLTIKKMIISILNPLPEGRGLTAGEMVDRIKQVYRKDVERTSLSPQLSRLKSEEVIEAFDGAWFIKGKAPPNDTQSNLRQEGSSNEKISEGSFKST